MSDFIGIKPKRIVALLGLLASFDDDWARAAEMIIERGSRESRASPASRPKETIEPLMLSIKDAARLLGLGRSTIYRLIGEGELETVKVGNRTLIKTASIRRLVENKD